MKKRHSVSEGIFCLSTISISLMTEIQIFNFKLSENDMYVCMSGNFLEFINNYYNVLYQKKTTKKPYFENRAFYSADICSNVL